MIRGSQLRRKIASRYPLIPFRGRLPFLGRSADDLPEGLVVDTRAGIRIKVGSDQMYHDAYFWGDYEPYHTKIYRRIVRPGQTVIDVGANFGWFTTLFARWVGEHGQVHAFEPVPFIHEQTAATLQLNDLSSRVHLNQLALGHALGSITIRTYGGLPHGHATAADLGRHDATAHTCVVTTLDEYCKDNAIDEIHFMKVDVEGFEPDVFAGGSGILATSSSPIIAFEVNGTCLQARSLQSSDVIGELRSLGYSHFYRFSTRRGIRQLESDRFEYGDCIAAKPSHLGSLERALKTGRLVRDRRVSR